MPSFASQVFTNNYLAISLIPFFIILGKRTENDSAMDDAMDSDSDISIASSVDTEMSEDLDSQGIFVFRFLFFYCILHLGYQAKFS